MLRGWTAAAATAAVKRGGRGAWAARRWMADEAAVRHDDASTWATSERAVRNVCIIAHVDHGKTTLAERLLEVSGRSSGKDRSLDSNDLERERGITILSKATGFEWRNPDTNNSKLWFNLVDTPGHADFGGEVERVLNMVDCALLVVDAREGPMPQTRYVLRKALSRGLKPVVAFNKVDRDDARIGEVESEVLELFLALNASEEQLDFPIVYCSARDGWATTEASLTGREDMGLVLDALVRRCPPPRVLRDHASSFRMLVTQIELDNFVGKIARGRVAAGTVKYGDEVTLLERSGQVKERGKVTRLTRRVGLASTELAEGLPGDIVEVAGLAGSRPTDTIIATADEALGPLRSDPIDPPTISMVFGVNDSPLAGSDGGDKLTAAQLARRLQREADANVAIVVAQAPPAAGMSDAMEVFGRGELQLAVLIETMRREGYELSIAPPRVVIRQDPASGESLEPWEEVSLEVPDALAGQFIEKLSRRRGELKDYQPAGLGVSRLVFEAPARALLGFQAEFRAETRGEGVMTRVFARWGAKVNDDSVRPRKGALVSTEAGNATTYALAALEPRGILFVEPGDPVYTGMVVGEHSRENDLDVNAVRAKKLTNIRAAGSDELVQLQPARKLPLEEAISWIQPDELLEVTPKSIRIRKRVLDPSKRKVASRSTRAD